MATVLVVVLFVVNGRWGDNANVDAVASAIPAWSLVEESTLDLTPHAGENPWFVQDASGRIVSDRAPGLIATPVPAYALARVSNFSNSPATVTAMLTTLAAAGLVLLMVRPLLDWKAALAAGVVFALGTTTWSVSSAQLWPHGPGQLAALLTVAAMAASRYLGAGMATAWAITMRPIAAVYAAVIGILESARKRDWRPAMRYGSLCLAGMSLVLIYNRWLFGQWSLDGGGADGLTGRFGDDYTLSWHARNLWTMLFSLRHGVLVLSPVVLVTAIGAIVHRKVVPPWARSAAIGGAVYLLVHAAFNRASGGAQLFYRYPLEALALAAVALAVGGAALYRSSRAGRLLVTWSAGISIAIQFVNVFYLSCITANPYTIACQIL